jgi:serine/threonine-protein kinase RsbT
MQQLERPALERMERVNYMPTGDTRRATFSISGAGDATIARQYARFFAERTGFTYGDQIVIDAVLGEMATNVLNFAGKGEFVFGTENHAGRTGMVIIVRDQGPGIPDVSSALVDGYSTSGRPGLGLAASRRLMDSFHVASAEGEGTTITMKKWRDVP